MYDYNDDKRQVREFVRQAEKILDSAKAKGRHLTDAERTEVRGHLDAAGDAKDRAVCGEQIEAMQQGNFGGAGGKSSSQRNLLFDPSELDAFTKAAASGELVTLNQSKATLVSGGAGLYSDFRDGTVTSIREPFRVARLFPTETTDGPSVAYRRITTSSAAAAAVAEGALKPESAIVASQLEAPVRKLAVYLPVAEEVIEDGGPSFVNDIVADLVADLVRVENVQLLSGSGVAPNLAGILQTSGLLTRVRGTDSSLDAVLKGITQLRTVGFIEPTDILVHPANFESIRLSKATGGE